MNDEFVIRKASAADADRITTLINQAFGVVEQFFVDGDRITKEEVLDSLVSGTFLLSERKGALAGCVYIEPRGTRAYLGLLSVDPKLQQKGTGSNLMTAGEEYCRELGCQFMDIKIVNLRSELPAFYGKRGYVLTGSSPFPPEVETKMPCHFIDMSKQLIRSIFTHELSL
jgi:N-acetylglutamate synthase-like GNAT family acetyltransferase